MDRRQQTRRRTDVVTMRVLAVLAFLIVAYIIYWNVNERIAYAHKERVVAELDLTVHRGMTMAQVKDAIVAAGESPSTVDNSINGKKMFVSLKWPGVPFTAVHFITYVFNTRGRLVDVSSTEFAEGL